MDMDAHENDSYEFKRFEKKVARVINDFIVTIDPKTNIIKKRKYYIYKFFVDYIDLLYVYGSFHKYNQKDYNYILKNNFTDCGDLDVFTCREENIECNFELEGLLHLDRIILNEINYTEYKNYNIFNKKIFIHENREFIENSLYLEILKSITLELDKERNNIYNEYSENIFDIRTGFIICIEKINKNNIEKYVLYETNKSVSNTIMSLYKKSIKDETIDIEERNIINAIQNFNFNTDKIKFINYFVDEEDIYQKYLFYKKKYEQY